MNDQGLSLKVNWFNTTNLDIEISNGKMNVYDNSVSDCVAVGADVFNLFQK